MKLKINTTLLYRSASKMTLGLFVLVVIASAITYNSVVLADNKTNPAKTVTFDKAVAVAVSTYKASPEKRQIGTKKTFSVNRQTAAKPTTPNPSYAPIASSSPRGMNLYINPSLAQSGRPTAISSQPVATWLGSWSGDIRSAAASTVSVAASQSKLATLVVYNIPGRDCGSYSAGGSASAEAYKAWIRQLAAGIGTNRAMVILEPDALAQINCLSGPDQAVRYSLLADAVNVLATQTKAFVYIDAGHSGWIGAATMADRLKKANVGQARGFSLNVSNFVATDKNTAYGNSISAATGKAFVIDTSRNGNGDNGEWCNPRGRALGPSPTTNVGGNVDAYLWIKVPGESDGTCNGGPSAGTWWNEYAQELIANRR